MTKLSPTTLLLVVIVVAVVMAPQILESFTGLVGRGWDQWQKLFELPKGDGDTDTTDGDDVISGGESTLALTIYYQDGTKRDFKPAPFSILPLEILDSGKAIDKVQANIYVTPTQSGQEPVSWDIDGTLETKYVKPSMSGSPTTIKTEPFAVDDGGTSWQNQEEKRVASFEFTAGHIENVVASRGEGSYSMSFHASIELQYEYADGSVDAASGEAQASWSFAYEKDVAGELQSISVRVRTNPLYT